MQRDQNKEFIYIRLRWSERMHIGVTVHFLLLHGYGCARAGQLAAHDIQKKWVQPMQTDI
jgi:hypothetical protein